ncbi:head-tail adaptor protein [Cypionkella sp.]|uniref:head-tail adaptor protein n=1 Tax=Cypionkella sp. TaxID=2811411 RepID=UPI0037521005
MRPITLSRPLTLEASQTVADGAGGFHQAWQALGTLWAELVAGTGREAAGEEVTLSTVAYRITVRAAPIGAPTRPKPSQRFRDGTRVFAILAVSERDAEARYLTCIAREESPT